jgi:hypothetical protein
MKLDGEQLMQVMVSLLIVVAVGGVTLGMLAAPPSTGGDQSFRQLEASGGSATIQTGITSEVRGIVDVQPTLGDAVQLTGAPDSTATVDADLTAAGTAWSVSAVVDGDAVATNRTIVGASLPEHDVVIWYEAGADEYHGWVYNESSESARSVSITAAGGVNSTTILSVERLDNGTLQLARNTTVVTEAGGATTTVPPQANWRGTVDELRVREPLSNTQRQALVDEPATALPGGEPVAIAKFDSRSDVSTLPVYWTAGEVTLSNASLVDGVAGPPLTDGTDYRVDGATIKIVDSGILEPTGEVLFVELELDEQTLLPIVRIMVALFMLAVVAVPLMRATGRM